MTAAVTSFSSGSAAALREEFDRGFAQAVLPPASDLRDFVLVQVSGAHYALPATQLAGIEPRAHIVPVPSTAAPLLGIAGVAGAIVPVFSLARLLGLHPHPESPAAPAFALVTAGSEPGGAQLGLAFDTLLHFARVPAKRLFAAQHAGGTATLLHQETLYVVLEAQWLAREIVRSGQSRTPSPSTFEPSATPPGGGPSP